MVVIEDDQPERVMTAEKRNFLFSGVPEEMKRQRAVTEAAAAMAEATEHAPWPSYNHIQQMDVQNTSWNLPMVHLSYRNIVQECTERIDASSQWEKTQRGMTQESKQVRVAENENDLFPQQLLYTW